MSWLKKITELWQGQRTPSILVENTATLPAATGSVNLFTVTGGRVRLTDLVGSIVTSPDGTAATILARLRHTPATGVTNMCTDIADIKGWLANRLLTITGAVANAMADGGVTGIQVLQSFTTNQQTLEPGIISLLMTEGAGGIGDIVGAIKWTIRYIPMDPGATVAPA
jgi:energy-converting hydrogenase Eha subunit B